MNAGRILAVGQPVVVRGLNNDDMIDAGVFIGVNEHGQAVIDVTVNFRDNGQVIATDHYYPVYSLERVYAVEEGEEQQASHTVAPAEYAID